MVKWPIKKILLFLLILMLAPISSYGEVRLLSEVAVSTPGSVEPINPMRWGGGPSASAAVNATAIASALALAATAGETGEVYLSPGEWHHAGNLTIPAGVRLYGSWGKRYGVDTGTRIAFDNTGGIVMGTYSKLDNLTIIEPTIGIYAAYINWPIVRDVQIMGGTTATIGVHVLGVIYGHFENIIEAQALGGLLVGPVGTPAGAGDTSNMNMFLDCVFSDNRDYGVKVRYSSNNTFIRMGTEANGYVTAWGAGVTAWGIILDSHLAESVAVSADYLENWFRGQNTFMNCWQEGNDNGAIRIYSDVGSQFINNTTWHTFSTNTDMIKISHAINTKFTGGTFIDANLPQDNITIDAGSYGVEFLPARSDGLVVDWGMNSVLADYPKYTAPINQTYTTNPAFDSTASTTDFNGWTEVITGGTITRDSTDLFFNNGASEYSAKIVMDAVPAGDIVLTSSTTAAIADTKKLWFIIVYKNDTAGVTTNPMLRLAFASSDHTYAYSVVKGAWYTVVSGDATPLYLPVTSTVKKIAIPITGYTGGALGVYAQILVDDTYNANATHHVYAAYFADNPNEMPQSLVLNAGLESLTALAPTDAETEMPTYDDAKWLDYYTSATNWAGSGADSSGRKWFMSRNTNNKNYSFWGNAYLVARLGGDGHFFRANMYVGGSNTPTDATAKLHINAGTATAGTAPLKLTSGTVLTSPEAGAMEFNTDTLYFTTTTGPTRKSIAYAEMSVAAHSTSQNLTSAQMRKHVYNNTGAGAGIQFTFTEASAKGDSATFICKTAGQNITLEPYGTEIFTGIGITASAGDAITLTCDVVGRALTIIAEAAGTWTVFAGNETDPQVGTVTDTKVCVGDASGIIQCTTDPYAPINSPTFTGTVAFPAYERHLQIPVVAAQIVGQENCAARNTVFIGSKVDANSDLFYLQTEVTSDWNGTDMYFEVDWYGGDDITDTQTVIWKLDYAIVAENADLDASTVRNATDVTYTSSGTTSAGVVKHSRFTLTAANLTVGYHIFLKLYRDATNDTYNDADGVCITAFEHIYNSTALPQM